MVHEWAGYPGLRSSHWVEQVSEIQGCHWGRMRRSGERVVFDDTIGLINFLKFPLMRPFQGGLHEVHPLSPTHLVLCWNGLGLVQIAK